jgi:hypothetical protein
MAPVGPPGMSAQRSLSGEKQTWQGKLIWVAIDVIRLAELGGWLGCALPLGPASPAFRDVGAVGTQFSARLPRYIRRLAARGRRRDFRPDP